MTPERSTPASTSDWSRLVRAVGSQADNDTVEQTGADLVRRWGESHRGYHNLRHLTEVLDSIDLLASEAGEPDRPDRPDAVRLAAWFHDAVYDPGATDNERRSAELAIEVLTRLSVPPETTAAVDRLVRITSDHVAPPDDRDAAVLCDADLAVLAAEPARYTSYVAGVRSENHQLTEATFAAGRHAVLRTLLDRPALFSTEHGRAHWETVARSNMQRELVALEDGDSLTPPGAAPHPAPPPTVAPRTTPGPPSSL